VNNPIKMLCCIFLASGVFISTNTQAQENSETNICSEAGVGVVLAFMNGVLNTTTDVEVAKQELKRIHGPKSAKGDEIIYESLYNQTGGGLEDFVETFEQRLKEHGELLEGRFELFFEALKGGGSWWETIRSVFSSTVDLLGAFVDQVQAKVAAGLTRSLANPPTMEDYAEHRTRIDTWLLQGQKLLLVAHSQGNLFANAAYKHALTKTTAASVKVVHIAPASPTVNGPHTLADLDLVINALRLVGSVPSITDRIPGYLLRPAGINGETDALAHGLLPIYLNQKLDISARVKSHIQAALDSLVAPAAQTTLGFFTVTLTWNGSGDVDLHVFEPGGTHVYFRKREGESGHLDLDNIQSDGPEHYYATCDSSKLQTGTYQISVANYRHADGRTATVQIASQKDGVLGTKSVVVGEATANNPKFYPMFNVVVRKDEPTGTYSVSLE